MSSSMSLEDSNSSDSSSILSVLEKEAKYSKSFEDYVALVSALQEKDELSRLRSARLSFADFHSLPESLWVQWLNDEHQLAVGQEEQSKLLLLTERATRDCPTPSLCLLRLNFVFELAKLSHPHAHVSKVFEEILWLGAAAHFTEGAKLWEALETLSDSSLQLPTRPPLSLDTSDFRDGCQVFESRLEGLPENVPSDEAISIYLSYATYAAEVNTFSAVSVFERCIQRFPSNELVWTHYQDFCSTHPDGGRYFYVLGRATRANPMSLPMWSKLVVSIAQSPSNIVPNRAESMRGVIERVRPFVMDSIAFADASDLTKFIWSAFRSIGAPSNLYESVRSTLEFNITNTVEWASSFCHAAFIELSCSRVESGIDFFEQVVHARSNEFRWWLAFVDFLRAAKRQGIKEVYKRALDAMETVTSLDVIENAWLSFETSTDPEGLIHRTMVIVQMANDRRNILKITECEEIERSRKRERIPARSVPKRYRSVRTSSKSKPSRDLEKVLPAEKSDMDTNNHESFFSEGKHIGSMEEHKVHKSTQKNQQSDPGLDDATNKNASGSCSKSFQDSMEPRTIYLNNLPFRATEKDITEVFKFAGPICEVRLPRRSDGASKGFAYVEFEKDEQVDKALAQHNKPILGRAVWVRRSQPRPRKGKKSGRDMDLPRSSKERHERLNLGNIDGLKSNNAGAKVLPIRDVNMEDDKTDRSNLDDGPKTQADFRAMLLNGRKKMEFTHPA